MSYTLDTNDNGYGIVHYKKPCGAQIPICQVWYNIRNDQNTIESPVVNFYERSNTLEMVNRAMELITAEVQKDLYLTLDY